MEEQLSVTEIRPIVEKHVMYVASGRSARHRKEVTLRYA